MRLATLTTADGPRAVVVRDDGAALIQGYRDVGAVLRDPGGLEAARAAAGSEATVSFDIDRLRRPILSPSSVICVGLNYRTHILEMGRELPAAPTLFSKLSRALADPYADIELPRRSERVDYEGELAIVIATGGRDIPAKEAWSHVAGLTILNDITARDFQRRTVQWFAGKTFQASTPVGPWIVTPDEFGDPADHELVVTVNAEERQRARLDDLVFGVESLVADLSQIVELEPGDVIATGTPGGVGEPDGRFLAPGDEVAVSIGGIGEIRNRFVQAPS
jgi:acylpyruvate hydrolase